MNIMDIIDTLDELLDRGVAMPMMRGKLLVDSEKMGVIIGDLRNNLPRELAQAREILAKREEILQSARSEADTMLKRAEDRARAMVAQQEILRQAQERAKELTQNSEQRSSELVKASHVFADSQLETMEELLGRQLAELRQVRQVIKKSAQTKLK